MDLESQNNLENADKVDGEGDSLCDILIQKERIRSLITPDEPIRQHERIQQAVGEKKDVIGNHAGRSPYSGAQLKVVSVNHKNQKNDPVFAGQLQNDNGKKMEPIPEIRNEGEADRNDGARGRNANGGDENKNVN